LEQSKICQYQYRTVTNADYTATQEKENQQRLQNCTEMKNERGFATLKHDMHARVPHALTTQVDCPGNVRMITFRLGFERPVARERTNRIFRPSTYLSLPISNKYEVNLL
jgi:hypothetical protein